MGKQQQPRSPCLCGKSPEVKTASTGCLGLKLGPCSCCSPRGAFFCGARSNFWSQAHLWRRPSFGKRAPMAPEAETTFEQAQELLLQKIKGNPSLKPLLAKKILELVKGLDDVDLALASEEIKDSTTAADRIKQGFLNFKNGFYLKHPELYKKLSTGQAPKFMIIACSDSRVCPTTILGLQPGEAFMVRNIASMVPSWGEGGFPGTSAALEYAVLHLKVQNILVIGHSKCGGIRALVSLDHEKRWSDYIQDWIKISAPARSYIQGSCGDKDIDAQCTHCEKASVDVALGNLLTFPWIKEAVMNKKLALHGGHYSFVDGSFDHWTLDVSKSESTLLS